MHIGMYILCNMYVRKLNYRRPNEAENDGQAHKGGRCLSVYSLDYRSRSRTKSAVIYYLAWRQPNFCSQNIICFLWGHVFMMNFNNGIKLNTLHNLLNKYLNVIISYCIIGGFHLTLSFYNNEPSKNKHFLILPSSLAQIEKNF